MKCYSLLWIISVFLWFIFITNADDLPCLYCNVLCCFWMKLRKHLRSELKRKTFISLTKEKKNVVISFYQSSQNKENLNILLIPQ